MHIIDPWHWLNEDGDIQDIPRLRGQTIRVAQIIEYGGPLPVMHGRETLIPCRRRPERKPCTGFLVVLKQQDNSLRAYCPICHGDEYLIHNWEETQWAEGPMPAVPVEVVSVH